MYVRVPVSCPSVGMCVSVLCALWGGPRPGLSPCLPLFPPWPEPAVPGHRGQWRDGRPAADWWGPGESCCLPLLSRGMTLWPPAPCPHLLGVLSTLRKDSSAQGWCSCPLCPLQAQEPLSCLSLTLTFVNQGGQGSWGVTGSALGALRRHRRAPGKWWFNCVQDSLEQGPHISDSSYLGGGEGAHGEGTRLASPALTVMCYDVLTGGTYIVVYWIFL